MVIKNSLAEESEVASGNLHLIPGGGSYKIVLYPVSSHSFSAHIYLFFFLNVFHVLHLYTPFYDELMDVKAEERSSDAREN
jgi:hypothetical protein